jgi:hypothetical protein
MLNETEGQVTLTHMLEKILGRKHMRLNVEGKIKYIMNMMAGNIPQERLA